MKTVWHKDGSFSFTFSKDEMVHGSAERIAAVKELVNKTGGPWAWIGDVIEANEKEVTKNTSCFGSDTLKSIMRIFWNSIHTTFGKGCWKSMVKEFKNIN